MATSIDYCFPGINMQKIKFQNQDCILVENNKIQLIFSQSIGPRILGFNLHGAKNILAEIPDFKTPLPDGSYYHMFGGHRLWIAPENIPLTYSHDNQPVSITIDHNTIIIKKEIETQSGMEKSLKIQIDPDTAKVEIEHILKNCGNQPIDCAAWAITQLIPGGVAILPQSKHDSGLLPNRSLALWSYTNMACPQVSWENDCILVEANMDSPFKVGFPNPRGWLAYWLDGVLFVKKAQYFDGSEYYDLGSSSECYCNDQFLELETLGPKTTLNPGASVSHVEIWELFEDVARPVNGEDVARMVEKSELDI
jgi:hypothetical protein